MTHPFAVTAREIEYVLRIFGQEGKVKNWREISRYRYRSDEEKQVRLILYVKLDNDNAYILKFLNENDHPRSQVEEQSVFSELLRKSGILCAQKYAIREPHAANCYTVLLTVGEYQVYVTAERYEDGEIKAINADNAYKIGMLLARAHSISEENDCHVNGKTLFDPFERNDLFFYDNFEEIANRLPPVFKEIVAGIKDAYRNHLVALAPLRDVRKYAVQGDISNNNLYLSPKGEIGMYDFNNCADNRLLCDAILQGIFLSRLMDYEETPSQKLNNSILRSFLCGYISIRSISQEEWEYIAHLYAITTAFWGMDILYDKNSLSALLDEYILDNKGESEKLLSNKLICIHNALLEKKTRCFFL